MSPAGIIPHRLSAQQITQTTCTSPGEIVSSLVAMQAQEFAQAKWAIGLRLAGSTEREVDAALNSGQILRTHLLRPTWHFVAPADIRWLLALTAPQVIALSRYMYTKMELDSEIFLRCNDLLAKALEGGRYNTRAGLNAILKKAKIEAEGIRLSLLFMRAELDGVICSGPRQGKQFTYALLEERVAAGKILNRAEALAALSNRYFLSRGPATVHDFATWSGLSIRDAREGIGALPTEFERIVLAGKEYLFAPGTTKPVLSTHATFLMPDYDEYGMSYKDRSAIFGSQPSGLTVPAYKHTLIVNGRSAGTWQYKIQKGVAAVDLSLYASPGKRPEPALQLAVKRFKDFFDPASTAPLS